jgi:hypothetical protein
MKVESPAQQLFFSTVRIEGDVVGTPPKTSVGTAFCFLYQKNGKEMPFLVTNKHVVKDTTSSRLIFTKSGPNPNPAPLLGQRIDVTATSQTGLHWHGHPSPDIDVAVMPILSMIQQAEQAGNPLYIKALPDSFIPTPEQVDELDALEEILFIGYPNGLYDQTNLTPIARKGTTATPLQLDYNGKPMFLIDASVFEGSSGSPVFILNDGVYTIRGKGFTFGMRCYLLGVLSSVLGSMAFNPLQVINTSQIPGIVTTQRLNLGCVYKTSSILETVLDFVTKFNISFD